MRSKKIESRVPWNIYEAARKRCDRLGMRSLARYVIYLMLMDTLNAPRSNFIREVANADPEDQDAFVDYLLATPGDPREIRAWLQRNMRAQKTAQKERDIE